MIKPTLRIAFPLLLAIALASSPSSMLAQATNKPAATKSAPGEKKAPMTKSEPAAAEKKKSAHPFRGKLAAIDKKAKTIQVGKSLYQVTAESKIKKDGKPATFEDGVVGEPVSGYVKPNEEGKMVATTVNFGTKPETKGTEKKK